MTKSVIIYERKYEIANKDLLKEVSNMVKAFEGLQKNTWQYAISAYNVISQELYKEDFKNVANFAKALAVSETVMSKYYNAVKCYVEKLEKLGYTIEQLSVNKCYLLSTLKEEFETFLKWIPKETNLVMLTSKELEDLLRKFNKRNEIVNEETEETETEETETEETEKLNTLECIEDNGFITLKYKNNIYSIPVEDLEEYRV